jgi:hypothetical protein
MLNSHCILRTFGRKIIASQVVRGALPRFKNIDLLQMKLCEDRIMQKKLFNC